MTWLVEHDSRGSIRCLQHIESGEVAWEPLPVYGDRIVQEIPESIAPHAWFASRHGCFECGAGWAAIGPLGVDMGSLECARCGAVHSTVAVDEWCYRCGASFTSLREPGCPEESQCVECGQMTAVVA